MGSLEFCLIIIISQLQFETSFGSRYVSGRQVSNYFLNDFTHGSDGSDGPGFEFQVEQNKKNVPRCYDRDNILYVMFMSFNLLLEQ